MMAFKLKASIITASVGNLGERFLTSGYKEDITFEEKLKRIASIEGLSGVELCYSPEGDEADSDKVKTLLNTYDISAPVVNAPLVGEKTWMFGSLSSTDEKTRQKAIEIAKRTIDYAVQVGSPIVNFWLGQDGFDYPFQVDYSEQWNAIISSVRECADYNTNISVALEFKPREPRNRSLINNVGNTLYLVTQIDRKNVGITVDNGHVLQNGENMAQAVELCANAGKLFNMHMNDNYASWDDDMMVGSIHLIEYLELFYVLQKINYEGWCAIDIFPFREDSFRATEESLRYMDIYNNWVNEVGIEKINKLIQDGNTPDTLQYIRKTVFK
jgi:sugar phosphate isomerase/epimerase